MLLTFIALVFLTRTTDPVSSPPVPSGRRQRRELEGVLRVLSGSHRKTEVRELTVPLELTEESQKLLGYGSASEHIKIL